MYAMPMLTVTRRLHFCAAHRLFNASYSDEQNASVFGPCSHPNYHGHNYELDVSVTGEIDPETGYVADLGEVKRIVEDLVLQHLDHKNLSVDVPAFRNLNPSTENLVVVIWRMLEGRLPGKLKRLVLWETPRNYVSYEGG